MKKKISLRVCFTLLCAGLLLLQSHRIQAQICHDALDTVFGLTTGGILYPINVNNTTAGTLINASGATGTASSNGVGFSTLDGKFYYFNKTGTGAAPSPQFVSYDPVSTTLTTLPNPPATITSAQKIRTGCVNNLGSGYYTINPSAVGVTPALYYYNITTAAWTTITSSFVDPSLASLNTTFHNLNSGDMAFDGVGNLWILLSSTSSYALYKISAPVPTTAVASVTATQIIGTTNFFNTTAGFTGLAFNSAGTLYMSRGTGIDSLYKLVTVASGIVPVGKFATTDIGADLTSCVAPMWVLSSSPWQNFSAVWHNGIELSWKALENNAVAGYYIEYSTDGEHWQQQASIAKSGNTGTAAATDYHYTDQKYQTGNNFYRIVQYNAAGERNVSSVRLINTAATHAAISIGPNPSRDIIYIYNRDNSTKYMAQVFDRSGRLVYSTSVEPGQASVNVASLQKGSYILKLYSPVNASASSHQFIKW